MTPEKEIQKKIIAWLDENSIIYFRRQAGGGNSYRTGLPDLYGTFYGRHFEIECKQEKGKLSSAQLKWKKIFEADGTLYIIGNSFENFLEAWNNFLRKVNQH